MTGSAKVKAVSELERRRTFEPDWPATMIFECNSPAIFVDQAAAIGFEIEGDNGGDNGGDSSDHDDQETVY